MSFLKEVIPLTPISLAIFFRSLMVRADNLVKEYLGLGTDFTSPLGDMVPSDPFDVMVLFFSCVTYFSLLVTIFVSTCLFPMIFIVSFPVGKEFLNALICKGMMKKLF